MYLWWHNLKENFFAEQSRWFSWVPVLYGLGIMLYFALPFEPSRWWTLGIIEALIVIAVLFRYRLRVLSVLLVLAIITAGFATVQLKSIYLARNFYPPEVQNLYLQGQIKQLDYNSRGNQRFVLGNMRDFDLKEIPGLYRFSTLPQKERLQDGMCVEMAAKIMPLPQPAISGGFQLDRNLFFKGLSGSGYSLGRVIPMSCDELPGAKSHWSQWVSSLRQKILARIQSVLPPEEASVTAAIIAGEQGGIKRSLIQTYRDSGLAHFLSISGLHMSMLAGLMFFFIRLLVSFIPSLAAQYDSKKISALFAIIISFNYLLISGAAIPAQRAFIMTFIVLLGVLFSRRAISMQTISWAALLVLFFNPDALAGPSFQMSFAAVVALIAFYERQAAFLRNFLSRDGNWLLKTLKIMVIYFVGILVSDLIASLATLPFAIYHFNRIALYTSLANLLAGPVIGFVIMPFVLLSLLLMPMGLDYWSLKIVGFGIAQVNRITAWVSSLPQAGFPVLSMPDWGLAAIVLGGLWLCLWQRRWRRWGWLGIIVGTLSISTVRTPDVIINATGNLLAVKDNQSAMVILPRRGQSFVKQVWLGRTASPELTPKQKALLKEIYEGETTDYKWLDLQCDATSCLYKKIFRYYKDGRLEINGKSFDSVAAQGASFYDENGKVTIETVKDYRGQRLWNKVFPISANEKPSR